MATQASPETRTDAEAKLHDALARMKTATERHAALVTVLSRTSVAPQERRLAQSEARKIEHELRDAQRQVREAQALAQGAAARKPG